MKHTWLKRGLLLAALIVGGLLFFRWSQESIVTPVYTVTDPDLPEAFDGFRIVHISDLHGKEFGENNSRLIEAVEKLEPDLIAITGDLIDQEGQFDIVPPLAESLCAVAPTYYVTGNHEWAVRRVNELKAVLEDCGVVVLSNEFHCLEQGGDALCIAGVDDPNGPADQKTGEQLRQEIVADYTVLLAHRNSVLDYAGWRYDLILCGHGHGGIIRVPILDKGVLGTDRNFFPTFDGGHYTFSNGKNCIESRGLGSNTVPVQAFRLFNRPDLPLIILRKGA